MRAMILAAGLGTRLGELSAERPKPLLPVADVPLIRYGIALAAGHGLGDLMVNLHHLGQAIVEELDGKTPGVALHWSREAPEILGTGGGLKRVADWLTDGGRAPFLVMNGKLVVDVDLTHLLAEHGRSGALATMVLREVPDAERWGAIDLDEQRRVIGVLGERAPGRSAAEVRHRTMFTGVHVVSPDLVARLPDGPSCVIRQGYLPLLRAGELLAGHLYEGYFQEHSTAERYLDGNRAVLRGEARLHFPPAALTGVHPSAVLGAGVAVGEACRIGAGARVGAGAAIGPETVVGQGAQVAPGVHVLRSVLWPGARLEEDVADAIVTRERIHRFGSSP